MLVEMVGPAGAGKSTLTPRLADALRQEGRTVEVVDLSHEAVTAGGMSRWGYRRACLRAIVGQPRLALALAPHVVRQRSRQAIRRVVDVCFRAAALRRVTPRVDVVLMDEGPWHRLAGLVAVDGRACAAGVRALPAIDATVFLDVAPDVAVGRALSREKWVELKDLPHGEAVARAGRYSVGLRRNLEGIPTVHADGDVKDVARELLQLAP